MFNFIATVLAFIWAVRSRIASVLIPAGQQAPYPIKS